MSSSSSDSTLTAEQVAAATSPSKDDAAASSSPTSAKGGRGRGKGGGSSSGGSGDDSTATDAPAAAEGRVECLANVGRASGFRDGLVYALQVLKTAPDLATATVTLSSLRDDTDKLLGDLERAERGVGDRLRALGVPT